MKYFLLTIFILASIWSLSSSADLKILGEWREMEFKFPTSEAKQNALITGKYVVGNSVPIDVDVDYKDTTKTRIFVTIPRFVEGIPVTLGTVTKERGKTGTLLQPYPEYSWHSSHGMNCDGMTSVFRVAVDECRRLWVLDSGRIGDKQHCHPQLIIFDLNTDNRLYTFKIPLAQFRPGLSQFVTPVIDVRDPPPYGRCSNTMVYLADVTGFGIVVFDLHRLKSWRIENKLMFPDPDFGTFTVAGESFDLMDGILGMTLSPKTNSGRNNLAKTFGGGYNGNNYIQSESDRILYFHSLASQNENSVPLRVLDNSTVWDHDKNSMPRSFTPLGSRGIQSAAQAMDKNGNLFFGQMDPISIACWDSSKPYDANNIRVVVQNDETLQFASGMKIITNRNGEEELWVLTDRIQKSLAGTMSTDEVNFRVMALRVQDLLGGTQCTSNNIANYNNFNNFQPPNSNSNFVFPDSDA